MKASEGTTMTKTEPAIRQTPIVDHDHAWRRVESNYDPDGLEYLYRCDVCWLAWAM
jgi:hypothetical protein